MVSPAISERCSAVSLAVAHSDALSSSIVQEARTLSLDGAESTHVLLGVPAVGVERKEVSLVSKSDPGCTFASRQLYKEPELSDVLEFMKSYLSKQVVVSFFSDKQDITGTLEQVTKLYISVRDSNNTATKVFWRDSNLLNVKLVDEELCGDTLKQALKLKSEASLEVTIATESPGEHEFSLMYNTSLITWHAEYEMRVNSDIGVLELTGNYCISNASPTDYSNASVRLLLRERTVQSDFKADKVNDNSFSTSFKKMMSYKSRSSAGKRHVPSHIYSIPMKVDLPAHSVVKIPICTSHMPYTSCYWFDANFNPVTPGQLYVSEENAKQSCLLKQSIFFKNASKCNLPPGSVSVYFVKDQQVDEEKGKNKFFHTIEEIYESQFEGCYLDQMSMIVLSLANAVKGVKERKTFKLEERTRKITESYVIQVTNEMNTGDIVVYDSFNRAKQWAISKATPEKYDVLDSQQVAWHFPAVGTGAMVEIKYTLTYTWEGSTNEPEGNMLLVEDESVFEEPEQKRGSFFSKFLSKK